MWVARAVVFEDVRIERVDDDVVMLVVDRLGYHTLKGGAYEVWLACDGLRSEREIAGLAYGDGSDVSVLRMRVALDALLQAGLVVSDGSSFASKLDRRRLTKMAALTLGGFGPPLVASITAPYAAAQNTCLAKWDSFHECGVGDSCRCVSGCCCQRPGLSAICYDAASCRAAGSGYSCI